MRTPPDSWLERQPPERDPNTADVCDRCGRSDSPIVDTESGFQICQRCDEAAQEENG